MLSRCLSSNPSLSPSTHLAMSAIILSSAPLYNSCVQPAAGGAQSTVLLCLSIE
ncbi:hypothetical protein PI126_g20251 [Phytophthora idaei]|nr:hypothetical protein PI126_g20251 [Phytophthora idaei]